MRGDDMAFVYNPPKVLKIMALRLHLSRQERPVPQTFPMPIGSRVLAWAKNIIHFLGNPA